MADAADYVRERGRARGVAPQRSTRMPHAPQAQRKERPMKLILSRKGFDSANGGCPSPIFPDGTMFSLPIPLKHEDKFAYEKLSHTSDALGKINIGEVVEGLTNERIGANHHAHMSPDLNPLQGWPRLFDQAGAAKGHLKNQGVGEGDLFLFFGLFREVNEPSNERGWHFKPNAPQQHVLWGWLQVGGKHDPEKGKDTLQCSCGNANTRYVARKQLDMGDGINAPGAGVFPQYDERLLLTAPGESVSHWKLPRWFYPNGDKKPLTRHRNRSRVPKLPHISPDPWEPLWKPNNDDYAYLESVGLGQEFVLDCDHYPESIPWALALIRDLRAR